MAIALSLLALALATALGYLYFPGHVYLQQDTQIWLPVLAHAADPTLFRQELIVTGAHIRLTIFDDVTLGLVRWFGLSMETALVGQQVVFRFLALCGVWLLARASGLSHLASVLAAVICNMGAVIIGPAVLTVEYEPVPRGFAFGLTLFALGLMAQGRHLLSGVALGWAFAYHAPAVWPVLLVAGWVFWRGKQRRDSWLMAIGFLGPLVVFACTVLFSVAGPMNPLFATLAPHHAELQRLRASYNWISLWGNASGWLRQYLTLAVVAAIAVWRVGKALPIAPYFVALPAIGLLSVPLSYLLLEGARLSLLPQVQIMRSLIFTLMIAVILMVIAGLRAAAAGRWWEAPMWLAPALFIAMAPVWTGKPVTVYLIAVALALGTALAVQMERPHRRVAFACCGFVFAACFFAPQNLASVRNYGQLGDPDLDGLATWARAHTAKDDVFLFRDIGVRNEPGLFRARALRAVYVDWKGGGQVNYYAFYAEEWWCRWQRFMKPPFNAGEIPDLRAAGVRYLVFRRPPPGLELEAVFANREYTVYRIG